MVNKKFGIAKCGRNMNAPHATRALPFHFLYEYFVFNSWPRQKGPHNGGPFSH
jgi:hypothetical protein